MGIKASPRGFNLGWRAGRTQWERRRTRDRNAVGRQNEKTDLVPRGGGVERCTGHYVEHWYRKSGLCGPNPASRTLPWLSLLHSASVSLSLSPRSASFPHVLETLEVREAPSHTLSPYTALNLIASVSAGKTFHFDQFVFSQQSILWLIVVWQEEEEKKKERLCRGCNTWTILSGNVGGQFCQQLQPGWTFSQLWQAFTVQCASRTSVESNTRYISDVAANANLM